MSRPEALALAAAALALAALVLVALAAKQVAEIMKGLDETEGGLQALLNALSGRRGERFSAVCFCIQDRSVQCFNATPIYVGETPLEVAAAFADITVGVRNGTLVVVSVPGHPECGKWSLVVLDGGSAREVGLLDPLRGGETLILRCDH